MLLDWGNFSFSVMIDLVTKPNFPVVTSEERERKGDNIGGKD